MTNKTRQERIDNGTLVPNSFQHPNLYVDWLHYYLKAEEVVVLDKAIREILGWEENISERKARIALSIFQNGKVSRSSGKQLCMGCGLGLHTIRKALSALHRYGVLVKDGVPTQDGQMYRLQDKTELIDWEGLEQRRDKWDIANKKRTAAATDASLDARSLTSDVRGNVARNTPNQCLDQEQTTTPSVTHDVRATSDVTPPLTSDVNNETQRDLYSNDDKDDLTALWSPFLERLSIALDRGTFDTWLRGSRLVAATNGTWTVELQHRAAVEWVGNRLYPSRSFQRVLETHAPQVERIEFIAKEAA